MTRNEDKFPDDVIVDIGHRDEIVAALAQRRIKTGQADDASQDLGLVLLRNLQGLDEYEREARKKYRNEIDAMASSQRSFTTLDVLLYDLRREFAGRGSVPVMGKNREALVGFPKHKGVEPAQPIEGVFEIAGVSTAGPDVLVGVVDTPFATHESLPPGIVDGDQLPPGSKLTDFSPHATFIAGLIRRAAARARVHVRAGLDPHVDENSSAWHAAKQIASFRNTDAAIVNLSFGCVTVDDEPPLVLRRAIDRLGSDVLVVASAGNRNLAVEGEPPPPRTIWPAACTDVVAVGATPEFDDSGRNLADFSMQRFWVDCTADGVGVESAYPFGRQLEDPGDDDPKGKAVWSGTSFSAAIVSGTVAAELSGDESPRDTFERMLANGHPAVKPYVPVR